MVVMMRVLRSQHAVRPRLVAFTNVSLRRHGILKNELPYVQTSGT